MSDIHGNIDALEAVLSDIRARGADAVVNLGDALSGPLFPAECADRLIQLGFLTIRGNHERQLLTLTPEQMGPSDRYTAQGLTSEHFRSISSLPETLLVFDNVLLVHGTPAGDLNYFLETVDSDGMRVASTEEVKARANGASAQLIPAAILTCHDPSRSTTVA